jgi:hypothetical protein
MAIIIVHSGIVSKLKASGHEVETAHVSTGPGYDYDFVTCTDGIDLKAMLGAERAKDERSLIGLRVRSAPCQT